MSSDYAVVCLSHLRWDFVYQRPQHLLSRAARERLVLYLEEPVYEVTGPPWAESFLRDGVRVVVPHIPDGLKQDVSRSLHKDLVDEVLSTMVEGPYVLWYYTPMALAFTRHLSPKAVVYDCMDELSAFAGAHPSLKVLEAELFRRADLVFCGGQSLYDSKRRHHSDVHLFPSSVDICHFAKAQEITAEPPDQAAIPQPRLGFYGVIDERMDLELLSYMADARPEWHLVMIGPTAKVDPETLPRQHNIHYLGQKSYEDLPAYLAGWDVALLPFALNESTRFISPTKTPEYLAAGKPVVSSAIADVMRPYGEAGLVRVFTSYGDAVAAVEEAFEADEVDRQARADALLARLSWDDTWSRMSALIDSRIHGGDRLPAWDRHPVLDLDSSLAAEEQAA